MWHFDKLSGRGNLIIWGCGNLISETDLHPYEFPNIETISVFE